MSTPCAINHRNNETRARCHNPECRRVARGKSASQPGGNTLPRPSSSRRKTIPDASGNPLVIDPDNPIVEKATLGPESVAALPRGTRFRNVNFKPGDYFLADATLDNCKFSDGSRLSLGGASVISGSTVRGDVFMTDDSFSSGNTFHGGVGLGGESASGGDYFASGYTLMHDSQAVIDRASSTFGEGAEVVRLEAPEQAAKSPQDQDYPQKKSGGRFRRIVSRAAVNIGQTLLWSLGGTSRGAGRRRRR